MSTDATAAELSEILAIHQLKARYAVFWTPKTGWRGGVSLPDHSEVGWSSTAA